MIMLRLFNFFYQNLLGRGLDLSSHASSNLFSDYVIYITNIIVII